VPGGGQPDEVEFATKARQVMLMLARTLDAADK